MSLFNSLLAQLLFSFEENVYSERSLGIVFLFLFPNRKGGVRVVPDKIPCDSLYLNLTL